jgi:hypothetical protein
VTLTYGDFGWLAQTDPGELMATLRVLERRVRLLLPPEDASRFVEALVSLKGECLKPKSAKSDWDAAEMYAKRATMRIDSLTLLKSSMLDLELQPGRFTITPTTFRLRRYGPV